MASSNRSKSRGDTASRALALITVIPLTLFGLIQVINPTALLAPGTPNSPGITAFAQYGAVRNAALILAALYLAWRFDRRILGLFFVMMIVVEFLDAYLGYIRGQLSGTIPPFILGVFMIFAALHLLRSKTA